MKATRRRANSRVPACWSITPRTGSTAIGSAGKMNGQGTLIRANGERYVGAWRDDLPNGPGTLTRADGSVVKGVFRDGKLEEAILDRLETVKADAVKKDLPDVHAFASISGKSLQSVDGSRIALTLIEGGIERQITDTGAASKKTTFTFMNDRLGTVVEDGGAAAGANVTGFFRLTDTGVEVRYADGRGELLTATPDGGVSDAALGGERRNQLPQLVSRRSCLQRSRQETGAGANMPAIWDLRPRPRQAAMQCPVRRRCCGPRAPKAKEPAAQVKPVSLRSPVRVTAPGTIMALSAGDGERVRDPQHRHGRAAGGDDAIAVTAGQHSGRAARRFGLSQGRKRWQSLGLPQCLRL